MKSARVVINILIFLGILLSTYFLHFSLTPDGYTGRFLWFTYDVHSPRNPAIVIGILVIALIIINWTAFLKTHRIFQIIGMSLVALALLAGVFFFLSYKRHNRLPWERPNVLVVVVDTLRADHVSAYGGTRAKTPNIDSLAEEGWLFEKAYSHIPITMPSHSSLFSGRLPHQVWVFNNTDDFNYSEPTLAEILKAEGYKTGAAVSLGVLRARHKLNRGFDYYNDSFPRDGRWYNFAEIITNRGIKWLDENAGAEQPFFLWLHYEDPHEPYCPPTPEYPDDVEILLNGERVAAGKLDSAAFVSAGLNLNPGRNEVLIRSLDPRIIHLYFTSIYFDGLEPGELPNDWQELLRRHTNRDRLRKLRQLQEPRFLTDFNGFEFAGLAFEEGEGWQALDDDANRLRRSAEGLECSMLIDNKKSSATEVTLRIKGGVRKEIESVWRDYAAEAEYNDLQVGRLLDYLKQKGLMDNTIIVFLSDHGEELSEHGMVGHINYLYTQSIHVPLIIRDPDSDHRALRVDRLARIIDIAPTILDMVGLHKPTYMEGRTLLEYILRNRSDERTLYAETFRNEAPHDRVGILEGDWLLVYNPDVERLRQLELYNLADDEIQWINLALSSRVGVLNSMANRARAYWQSMELIRDEDTDDEDIDDERQEMLRDLGYIQSGAVKDTSAQRGTPSDELIKEVRSEILRFAEVRIGDLKTEVRQTGGDGPAYIYAEIDLRTDEDDLLWPMVALQGHFKLHVLPLAAPFPIHLKVNVGGTTAYERVLALD